MRENVTPASPKPFSLTRLLVFLGLVVLMSPCAFAAVDVAPGSVRVAQGETSDTILVTITGRLAPGELSVSGLPVGTTSDPNPIPYPYSGPDTAQTTFQLVVGSTTPAGIYGVTLSDSNGNGSATVMLEVVAPTFEASLAPNPVTLQRGGATVPVTVTTTPEPGFAASITYSFQGFPSFISTGPAMTVSSSNGYAPVTFPFGATSTATPGTYSGLLIGTSGSTTKTYPMMVVVQRPDLAGSFTQTVVPLCNDGTIATNSLSLQPLDGYSGTPVIAFINLPAGITVTPSTMVSPPLPALLPFTIAASGATAGLQTISVRITDAAAGIDRTVTFSAQVQASDFTPLVTGAVSVLAGGEPAILTASATRTGCSNSSLLVTTSGAPAGVTLTPSVVLTAPAYAGMPLMVQAAANAAPGVYPISITFTPSAGGASKTLTSIITVVAPPDFELRVTPPAVTIEAGHSATVAVTIEPRNGFTGPVSVSVPSQSPVTVTPQTFTLTPGNSQNLVIAVPPNASPVTVTLLATGTSSQIAGVRTASIIVSVTPRAPALIVATPPSVATGMRSMTVRLTGANMRPGASITTTRTDVIIEKVTILSETLADVVLTVRAGAAPGPVPFVVTNPGGVRSNIINIFVVPSTSLSAPLGVSAALIVYPASGTMFTRRDSVYPRGLLATTGTGIVTGMWLLDGLPFDRFVVTVAGGMPAEVRSHIPVPWGVIGTHRLELAIDAPRQAISPAVEVLMSASSVSRLLVFAPRDGMVASAATLFRWSLMPNAGGYVIELEQLGTAQAVATDRIRVSDAEWRPSTAEIEKLRTGIHRWRVRPVFAGETEGEPSEWRRVSFLPELVTLQVEPLAGSVVRWSGGVSGVLYRVDVIDRNGRLVSSALTASTELTLREVPEGARVRVTALAPGGVVLGSGETPRGTSSLSAGSYRLVQNVAVQVTTREPLENARITESQPRIAAAWTGAVRQQNVTLFLDGMDVTAVAEITPVSIRYDSLLPLDSGSHRVQLLLGENTTQWSFTVDVAAQPMVAEGATEAGTTAVPPAARREAERRGLLRRDWAITPVGSITLLRDDGPDAMDQVRAQLSANTDLATAASGAKLNGDLSLRHDLADPNKTVQESRSWIGAFTGKQKYTSEELRAGYAVPGFLDQAELMTLGAARGGIEASVVLPGVRASYYRTFSSRPTGLVAGNFGPEQKVEAMALRLPSSSRWDLRFLGIRVEEKPDVYSSGGKGRALGIFGRFSISSAVALLLEASRGSFDQNGLEEREGNAFRFGLSGSRGTWSYSANLRRTDIGFVNPANRGFTPGAVADRSGGDLLITKTILRSTLSMQLRHLQDGNSSGAVTPKTRETGGILTFSTPIGQRVMLSLTGNTTRDRAAANADLFQPGANRTQRGVSATLSETVGRFGFSQTFVQQELKDEVSALTNQKVRTAMFSAAGTLWTNFSLSALLSGTRSEGAPNVGTNEVIVASLQPSFTIAPIGVTLQPRATYSRSEADLAGFVSELEQYQMVVSWAPMWLQSFVSLQLSTDWNRNRLTGLAESGFQRRYGAALSLRWGAAGGAAANATPEVVPPVEGEPYAQTAPLKSVSQ